MKRIRIFDEGVRYITNISIGSTFFVYFYYEYEVVFVSIIHSDVIILFLKYSSNFICSSNGTIVNLCSSGESLW